MRFKKSLKIRDEALGIVRSVIGGARTWKQTQVEYLESRRRVYKFLRESKCPNWVKHEVSGYMKALQEDMEKSHVFLYTMPNGDKVGIRRGIDHYEDSGYSTEQLYNSHAESGFYWDKENKYA